MIVTRIASPALYWPADEVGSQTHGRLRPGDLSLLYNACHILSICLVEIHWCLVLCAKSWGLAELGRLGNLLEGLQKVEWAINELGWAHGQVIGPSTRSEPLVGMVVSVVGGDPGVPMSHRLLGVMFTSLLDFYRLQGLVTRCLMNLS
jgi:hypothetical protein